MNTAVSDPSARLELPVTAERWGSLAGLVRELAEASRKTGAAIERHLREREESG
jgi:hypothetical protein